MDVKQEPINFCEYQTTKELVTFAAIKQECELPKIKGSDFLENIEHESVRDNVINIPNIIKKESENTDEVNVADIGDIKPVISEISGYVQFKDGSEFLTSHCDLPTLKSEDYTNHFAQPCSSKQTLIKLKSSKHFVKNVPKQKKRKYPWSEPWSVRQKIFRSSRKNLFNAYFGRFYETCFYCGQFFLTKSQFLYHFIVVHCVKKVTQDCKRKYGQHKHCRSKNGLHSIVKQLEICSKQFILKSNLSKPFKCEICSKQFIEKGVLKMHLRIHTGDNPFKCVVCSKQFIRKDTSEIHSKIHTGEKSFKCKICSKQFIRKGDLKTHLRIHTGEKPFKYKICLKPFAQKSNLKRHLIIHSGETPFKCEICSKPFKQKDKLKIHSGEKWFQCAIFSKQFILKGNLNKHFKIHIVEKLFKCEICSKQFIEKGDLKMHLRIHTGE